MNRRKFFGMAAAVAATPLILRIDGIPTSPEAIEVTPAPVIEPSTFSHELWGEALVKAYKDNLVIGRLT